MIQVIQNKHRRAIYTDTTVHIYTNKARKGNNIPVWRSAFPESECANPKEAARIWVEDCVVMFDVRA